MAADDKSSVKVTIYGEKYGIKSETDPDYTKRVAAYVDSAMHEITESVAVFDVHKVAILAAMSITDELFQAQTGLKQAQAELTNRSERLIGLLDDALNCGVEEKNRRKSHEETHA